MLKVQIINKGHQPLPAFATPQSAGMDLRANIDEAIVLHPMERRLVPTGLFMALPAGYEAQIRPRSGLALSMASPCSILRVPSMPITVAKSWCCSSTSHSKTSLSMMASASHKWYLPSTNSATSSRWRSWMKLSVVQAVMVIPA